MSTEVVEMTDLLEGSELQRDLARKRIQKRRNLQGGFVAYLVFNAFFVGVWAFTGAGYLWPVWVLGGWGVAMTLGMWDHFRGPITEDDVDEELRRGR